MPAMKPVGKPDAGNPHVRFDERGGETGRANGTAPFLDSTANASDGKIVALGNPNAKQLLGQDVGTLKDPTGKVYGVELKAGMQKPEGQFTEVSYLFPRPGTDKTPVPKVSLVTRASDLGCGVGYYKQ
jgi:hypothetical protein